MSHASLKLKTGKMFVDIVLISPICCNMYVPVQTRHAHFDDLFEVAPESNPFFTFPASQLA
jgi:hypothetical protein